MCAASQPEKLSRAVASEVTPTLGTGTPKAGYVFKTFRLDAANGLNGKGFIRVGAYTNAR